jgi:hypothetical protein
MVGAFWHRTSTSGDEYTRGKTRTDCCTSTTVADSTPNRTLPSFLRVFTTNPSDGSHRDGQLIVS